MPGRRGLATNPCKALFDSSLSNNTYEMPRKSRPANPQRKIREPIRYSTPRHGVKRWDSGLWVPDSRYPKKGHGPANAQPTSALLVLSDTGNDCAYTYLRRSRHESGLHRV